MKINRTALELLFDKSDVFANMELYFQDELLIAVGIKTEDLKLVTERKMATKFLDYLINRKNLNLKPYFDDLMIYLELLASLNSRDHITESDLYLLTKIHLSEIENWEKIILKALTNSMFKDIQRYIIQNSSFKDRLVLDVEKKDVSSSEVELTDEIIKWLNQTIKQLEYNIENVDEIEMLMNRFDQENIYDFYTTYVDSMLKHMRFQLRAFKLLEVY